MWYYGVASSRYSILIWEILFSSFYINSKCLPTKHAKEYWLRSILRSSFGQDALHSVSIGKH